jgi:hypothetical protein
VGVKASRRYVEYVSTGKVGAEAAKASPEQKKNALQRISMWVSPGARIFQCCQK